MNFNEVLINRRSTREFTSEDINKNQLYKILSSASLAPSARNRQPWKFYILNNEQKNHVMDMLFEWDKLNPKAKTSVKGTATQIREANKMIMIYSDNYSSTSKMINYKKPDYLSIRMCYRKYEFTSCRFRSWKLHFMRYIIYRK